MAKTPRDKTHPNAAAFPGGMSGPSLRALATAGVKSIDALASWTESELAALHGMGPKAIELLKTELRRRRLKLLG
jgi:DNA-directed RNA polymerase alpha subunit